jgi:hypothetical protein
MVSLKMKIPQVPFDDNMEEWLDAWRKEPIIRDFVSLPCFIFYFIWWVRNLNIFHNKGLPTEVLVDLICHLAIFFKKDLGKKKQCIPTMPMLVEETPWGFFDGASQGHPPICGVGVVLYITYEHRYEIVTLLAGGQT